MSYDRKDRYYRKAKAEGLRSRAAFKLEDLDRQLLRPGDRVLDLGCWPGGWLQVAARRVGAQGKVVGIDIRPLDPIALPQLAVIEGDVGDPAILERAATLLGGPADAILSDVAPQLTGIRDRDEARASDLVRAALATVDRILRPGGAFVCKVFMNSEYPTLFAEVRRRFEDVRATRSEATRKGSAELYWISRSFRAA